MVETGPMINVVLRLSQFAAGAIVLGCAASLLCPLSWFHTSGAGAMLDVFLAMANTATSTSMLGRYAYTVAIAAIAIPLALAYLCASCCAGKRAGCCGGNARTKVILVLSFDVLLSIAWLCAAAVISAGWTCSNSDSWGSEDDVTASTDGADSAAALQAAISTLSSLGSASVDLSAMGGASDTDVSAQGGNGGTGDTGSMANGECLANLKCAIASTTIAFAWISFVAWAGSAATGVVFDLKAASAPPGEAASAPAGEVSKPVTSAV